MENLTRFLLDGKEISQQDVEAMKENNAGHWVDGSIESRDENIDFGFTSIDKLENWVATQHKDEQKAYQTLRVILDRSRKMEDLTEEERWAIRTQQTDRVRHSTENFANLLQRHGISKITEKEVVPILKEIDAHYGANTLYLFRWPNFDIFHSNPVLCLSTGIYANLDWFRFGGWFGTDKGWGDRTTSYINLGAFIMFKNKYFGGSSYTCLFPKWKSQMSSSWDNNLDSVAYASYGSVFGLL